MSLTRHGYKPQLDRLTEVYNHEAVILVQYVIMYEKTQSKHCKWTSSLDYNKLNGYINDSIPCLMTHLSTVFLFHLPLIKLLIYHMNLTE